MTLGVVRPKKNGRYIIIRAHQNSTCETIAGGIKNLRDARTMAESYAMYSICLSCLSWAESLGLRGLVDDIQQVMGRINNPGHPEEPPEGIE